MKLMYPWKHFFKHPILVLLIAWNYHQRRMKRLPDEFYWADKKLLELEGLK